MTSVTDRSWNEAARLGHSWVGAEHLLLAVANGDEDWPVTRALKAAGLTPDRIEALLDQMTKAPPRIDRPTSGITTNPAWHQLVGFAEGLALAAGTPLRPEHVVLAYLWNERPFWSFETISREEILAALRAEGISVPPGELPPLDERRWTEHVEVPSEQLPALIGWLPRLLPPEICFGFNHDGKGQAWVSATEGVDLEEYVALALDRAAEAQ